MNTIRSVPLADIQDGGAQMRVEMDPGTVRDYADDMADGAPFPPIIIYHDGKDYWLGDGFHRVEAARKLDRQTIEAEVLEGDARQAMLHGIGSNASHGLRRRSAEDLWSTITEELEEEQPDLDEFEKPKAKPANEPDGFVLFDSRRDYLNQIDAYREWQKR